MTTPFLVHNLYSFGGSFCFLLLCRMSFVAVEIPGSFCRASMYRILIIWRSASLGHFPICVSFIFFTCIALGNTSSTVMNGKAGSRYPCFVPNFSGHALSFSPFSKILSVGLGICTLHWYFLQNIFY